jgi:hypothetical protein
MLRSRSLDALVTLSGETYQASFGEQSFCLKVTTLTIDSELAVWWQNHLYPKHRIHSVSEQLHFRSSGQLMTLFHRVLALSADKLHDTDPSTNCIHKEPDFLRFLFAAYFPRFPSRTTFTFQTLDRVQWVRGDSHAVRYLK